MKEKSTTKRSTAKKTAPEYKVNLTEAKTPTDVYVAFGVAKLEAGSPISRVEFDAMVQEALTSTFVAMSEDIKTIVCQHCHAHKPNVFKRFWNWVTKK